MNPIFAYYYSNAYTVYRTSPKDKIVKCYLFYNDCSIDEYTLCKPFTFFEI